MKYAGIGSRETSGTICRNMTRIGYLLAQNNFLLRSGKARGPDLAFQRGLEISYDKNKRGLGEILLPWAGWQSRQRSDWDILVTDEDIIHQAAQVCAKIHPRWHKLQNDHKLFHIRNMFQIAGPKMNDIVDFVIFGAPEIDGVVQGGTASAVHFARKFGIPNFNMYEQGPKALRKFLKQFGIEYKQLPKLELL